MEQYRKLSEIVWWLIAVDCDQDAMVLLDALCEVDDNYFWMFRALGSLRHSDASAARDDAVSALRWIQRDPNAKAIAESEVHGALERFDAWFARVCGEKGAITALSVLAHAMRVLVLYQQFGEAGDPAAEMISSSEFSARLDSGLQELRRRIEDC
jgi:hypothetical protein